MLGFRMYDNETGRFTTPDLLWSAFPAQTPYHYAYNSPLTYRDPTGLAPEKEKEGEELQNLEIDWNRIYAIWDLIHYENDRRSNQGMTNADGSPMGRTGAFYIPNGMNGSTYEFISFVPTSFGYMGISVSIEPSGIAANQTAASVMNAFIGGINDILFADPTFFDNLYGRDISIVIKGFDQISYTDKDGNKQSGALGSHRAIPNGSVVTLAGDVLTGNRKLPYSDYYRNERNKSQSWKDFQNYSIIAHEFGHALHWQKIESLGLGLSDFHSIPFDIRENYATYVENSFRTYFIQMNRYNYSYSLNCWNWIFDHGTWNSWNNYYKKGY